MNFILKQIPTIDSNSEPFWKISIPLDHAPGMTMGEYNTLLSKNLRGEWKKAEVDHGQLYFSFRADAHNLQGLKNVLHVLEARAQR